MTLKQKLLKAFYPILMQMHKITGKTDTVVNADSKTVPPVAFYTLHASLGNGAPLAFDSLKDKFVLIVNTASFCGYTGQYDGLEKLYQQYKDRLVILGFPANDFGGQEPGSNEDIAEFCRINYGVSFPVMEKAAVSGAGKQSVYQWLTDPGKNGWNSQEPSWNFCKYLISPNGVLLRFFGAGVDPLNKELTQHLAG